MHFPLALEYPATIHKVGNDVLAKPVKAIVVSVTPVAVLSVSVADHSLS